MSLSHLDNLAAVVLALAGAYYHLLILWRFSHTMHRTRMAIKLVCVATLLLAAITQALVVLQVPIDNGWYEATEEMLIASLLSLAMSDYGERRHAG